MKADTTIVNGNEGQVWILEMNDCVSKAPVKAIAIENKGHGWPGLEESGYDGTNASIDFLKQFSK
jgi:poly(3-hydroxybutyrate) depolymerase